MDQQPDSQMEALKRRRGKGIDLHIIIGNPSDDIDLMSPDDEMDSDDETDELGVAPDINDAKIPDPNDPDVARPTADGDMHAVDEEIGDTDNAADDEPGMDLRDKMATPAMSGKSPAPSLDMSELMGKGTPSNGLRQRANALFQKRKK